LTRARQSEEDVELLSEAAAGVAAVPQCRSLRHTARVVPRRHPCPRRRGARPSRRSLTSRPQSRRRTPSLPLSARSSASQAKPHRPTSEPEEDELEFAPGAGSGYHLTPPATASATGRSRRCWKGRHRARPGLRAPHRSGFAPPLAGEGSGGGLMTVGRRSPRRSPPRRSRPGGAVRRGRGLVAMVCGSEREKTRWGPGERPPLAERMMQNEMISPRMRDAKVAAAKCSTRCSSH
jgi:hypothetical protein